jgi:hypothetical protein
MSQTHADWRGITIELDNAETGNLLAAMGVAGTAGAGGIATALTSMGVPPYVAGIIGAAIAAHITWELVAIKAANQGQGVILTMPYYAPGVAIPSPRSVPDINQNWVAQRNGTFVTPGGDRVNYLVESGVEDPAVVTFRLVNQNQSGWDKSFILRDGQGSQWEIGSTVSQAGQDGLWAGQVHNGQQLTFRKPSFMGWWIDAFSVGGLDALQPGDRATFTWVQD